MLIVADNLQITRSEISSALERRDPEPIQTLVNQCLEAGAEAIDINSGPLIKGPETKMAFLVNAVQEITDKPILLDTSNPAALESGLKECTNPVIINGFSLEQTKLNYILPLAKKYDADIIGYLLYPNGHVPNDDSERLNIAIELYTAFKRMGLPNDRLIIDPVVAPVIWDTGVAQDRNILKVIRTLPEILGYPVKTIAGLSNLTTGSGPLDKRIFLEMSYLPMLACCGLSMVLLNVLHYQTVAMAKYCNILLGSKVFTFEELPRGPIAS